jgi:hypothetical protein
MRDRTAVTGDNDRFAGFDPVKKFAQVCLGFN